MSSFTHFFYLFLVTESKRNTTEFLREQNDDITFSRKQVALNISRASSKSKVSTEDGSPQTFHGSQTIPTSVLAKDIFQKHSPGNGNEDISDLLYKFDRPLSLL